MEVFGNIDINDVTPQKCEQLRNFFHPRFCDCVILTINERKADFFCASDDCITKGSQSCVTQRTDLTLNPPVSKPIICYLGNLYEDEESVKAGIKMYNNGNVTGAGNNIIPNLYSSFAQFFNSKRTIYDKFDATYSTKVKNHILQRIQSVFPFFLALEYMKQCDDPTCQQHIMFDSHSPKLEIKYCDDTIFEILETHTTFNPANIVAYIGSNKSYKLQLNGNRYREKRENPTKPVSKKKLEEHDSKHLRPIQRDPITKAVIYQKYQKTAWNVLHTVVREIISSERWENSTIIPNDRLSIGDIGSIIRFLAKRLNELQKNPYEMIDDFLENKVKHIEYTTRVFELVTEFQQNFITYKGFQSNFFAANHVYRHYDEIRKHVTETASLYHRSLQNYPEAFPENLPDNEGEERSNVEKEIEKCIVMYLYDVPFQHKNEILSPKISIVENKKHIQSIS